MSRHVDRFWSDRVASEYVEALDSGDLEAIAALWRHAESDPALEALLRELDEGIDEESEDEDAGQVDRMIVLELARRHLPSAFAAPEHQGPIRASDVAARLRADPELWRTLDGDDRRVNELMLARTAPLPDRLGSPRLARWGEDLGVSARLKYWDAFQKMAVRMRMGPGQASGHRAAARPSGVQPRRQEEDQNDPER